MNERLFNRKLNNTKDENERYIVDVVQVLFQQLRLEMFRKGYDLDITFPLPLLEDKIFEGHEQSPLVVVAHSGNIGEFCILLSL